MARNGARSLSRQRRRTSRDVRKLLRLRHALDHALAPARVAGRRRAASGRGPRRRDRRSCRAAAARCRPRRSWRRCRCTAPAAASTSRRPASAARRVQAAADRLVGGDAAGDHERGRVAGRARRKRRKADAGAVDHHVDDGRLEARRRDRRRPRSLKRRDALASMRTAVLRPENEKSGSSPPDHRARQLRSASGSPRCASRSTSGPPG